MLIYMRSIIILFVGLFSFTNVSSQIPQNLTIQGVFVDNNGKPLDGEHLVTSSVYYQENGGNSIYTQRDTIKIHSGGLYLISLGKNQSDFQKISFSKQLYIQLDIDNISSNVRIPLSTTPYSFMALKVSDSSITEANLDNNLIKKINDSFTPATGSYIGEMKYWNGSSWESIVPGKFSEQLTLCQGNIPRWGPCPGVPVVDIDRDSYYMSKNKVNLLFSAFDPARRDTLNEVGVIYGKKPDVSLKDSVLKLPVNKTGDFYSIELDILNDKSLTYVRVYAKNIAGITFSQELNLLGLSHRISEHKLIPDSSPYGSTVDWVGYDRNSDRFYYKNSFQDTSFRKSKIYTYDEINNTAILSFEYDSPNFTGIGSWDIIRKNENIFIDTSFYLFNFTDLPEARLRKRELKKSQNYILSLQNDKTFDFDFMGLEIKTQPYVYQYGKNVYLLGNPIEDFPYMSLYKLNQNNDFDKIKSLNINFPRHSSPNDMTIIDSTIILYYDQENNGEWPSIRSFDLNGNPLRTISIHPEYSHSPFATTFGSNYFFFIDWVMGEIKQYNKELSIVKTYKFPSLINTNLQSDNNCLIIEKQGFIIVFFKDRNNRILSYNLYQ
jgi:hypothetical protein